MYEMKTVASSFPHAFTGKKRVDELLLRLNNNWSDLYSWL
jgi:hypothetical protein